MAGFMYNLLSVEKDFDENEWKVYDEDSGSHIKPIIKLDGNQYKGLGHVLTFLSYSRSEKVVGYSAKEIGKYEVLMEKHVCTCKGKEEKTEVLPCSFPPSSEHSPISP